MDFLEAECPFIIVKQLTKEIIERAVKEYSKDEAYWLKMYFVCPNFDADAVNNVGERLRSEYHGDYSKIDLLFLISDPF